MSAGGVTTVLIGGAITVIVALIGWIAKNSRNSPEKRIALDAGWDKLTGGLERRLAALEVSDSAKTARIDEQDERSRKQDEKINHQSNLIADLETRLAAAIASLNRVQALNEWLSRRVVQLVAFIVSRDLLPPAEEPRP